MTCGVPWNGESSRLPLESEYLRVSSTGRGPRRGVPAAILAEGAGNFESAGAQLSQLLGAVWTPHALTTPCRS